MQQQPFIFSDEKKYRIRRHLAFWTFWWLFQGFLYSFIAVARDASYLKQLGISMIESLAFMPSHIFLGYALMYFVIPRFLLKQKYWLTALVTLFTFLLTATLSSLIAMYVLPLFRHYFFDIVSTEYRNRSQDFYFALLAGLRGGITIGGIAATIKLMKYWYMKEQRNLQLQKENVAAQLQLLKAQVHPHFLFNTLNNIYSFTQNSSPQAARMVTGLSDLLRFMLYEGSQPLVPLSKELKMVMDYINLEKIRYGNRLELSVDLPEETNELYIAPLLLLPLVENCFKHGTSNVLEQPWINLQLDINNNRLRMKLINGKNPDTEKEPDHTGIGIHNVKERLMLLYPNKHELTITSEEEIFIVNLKVELEPASELFNKQITSPR